MSDETLKLPEIIPVFPLTGSLLLPGNLLPLNIFDTRYRNLHPDVLTVFPNPSQMMRALRAFGDKHDLEFDYDLLASVPGISLLNGLSVALPFRPAEKQALLEAADPAVREELLLTLMGMGIEPLSTDEYYSPPILN